MKFTSLFTWVIGILIALSTLASPSFLYGQENFNTLEDTNYKSLTCYWFWDVKGSRGYRFDLNFAERTFTTKHGAGRVIHSGAINDCIFEKMQDTHFPVVTCNAQLDTAVKWFFDEEGEIVTLEKPIIFKDLESTIKFELFRHVTHTGFDEKNVAINYAWDIRPVKNPDNVHWFAYETGHRLQPVSTCKLSF